MTALAMIAAMSAAWADGPTEAEQLGKFRLIGGSSFLVADGDGVPDANRLFVNAGYTVLTVGDTNLAVEPAFALGYSEGDRVSWRLGANLEAEWVPTWHTTVYGALGVHYFRSVTKLETRRGALVRAAVGVRLRTGRKAFVGFEPLAIERFPDGEGVQTPLRSRWGVEVTFISVGVRL